MSTARQFHGNGKNSGRIMKVGDIVHDGKGYPIMWLWWRAMSSFYIEKIMHVH